MRCTNSSKPSALKIDKFHKHFGVSLFIKKQEKANNMNLTGDYIEIVENLQRAALKKNAENLQKLGALLGESLASGGVLHVFGSGHSGIVAREIVHRAGGLVPVSMIHDPTSGWAETIPGYGKRLLARYQAQYGLEKGEMAVIVSNSGRNPSPVEVAEGCAEAGLHSVAVTSLPMAAETKPAFPGGRLLCEVAETVLDNGVPGGDACLELPGHSLKTGPVSTFSGALLLQALVLEAIEWLQEKGHPAPILQSANTPGGREFNEKLSARYRHRLCRPL
jgi:uncharacterized phosphosugar-binding protein